MVTPKRSESYHHGNLRDNLVDLAIEKLDAGAEAGDLSIRALATELGVSIGAPYPPLPDGGSAHRGDRRARVFVAGGPDARRCVSGPIGGWGGGGGAW
jgi:hypothetical protein